MQVEIKPNLSNPNLTHIKIECENGDSIRLQVEEYLEGSDIKNRILVTSVDTYPSVQPKAANQILINFSF